MNKKDNPLDKSRIDDLDNYHGNLLHPVKEVEEDDLDHDEQNQDSQFDGEANFDERYEEESEEGLKKTQFDDEASSELDEDSDDEFVDFAETNATELSYDPKKKDALSAYLAYTKRFPVLSSEEEIQLAKAWKHEGSEAAKEKIVGSHLRLVAKMAQGYRGYSMPLLDLISEGHIGMMKALDKFDPDQGIRFSTYAMWWIKGSMKEYVMRNWSLVKTGTTAAQKKLFFNLRTIRQKMLREGQKYLTRDQISFIAKELNVPEKSVAEMAKRLNGNDYSLNTPIGGDNEGNWMDWLEDESASQESRVIQSDEFSKRYTLLEGALEHLKPRELQIMQMRRIEDPPKTLQEVSLELNLSRERVRQIEIKAFTKVQKIVKEMVRQQALQ